MLVNVHTAMTMASRSGAFLKPIAYTPLSSRHWQASSLAAISGRVSHTCRAGVHRVEC